MRRLDLVAGHLVETSSVDAAGACTRSDCVIVAGKRSAFGKAGKGAFANTRVEDLVSPVFRALLEKPVHVDDVLMGKVRLLFFFFFFLACSQQRGERSQETVVSVIKAFVAPCSLPDWTKRHLAR